MGHFLRSRCLSDNAGARWAKSNNRMQSYQSGWRVQRRLRYWVGTPLLTVCSAFASEFMKEGVLVKLTILAVFLALAPAFADTITLRNGQVISGTYLGGTAREVQMRVGNQIRTFDANTIARIEFGASAQPASSYPDDGRPTLRRHDDSQPLPDDATSTTTDSDRPVLRRSTLSPPPSADNGGAGQSSARQTGASDPNAPVLIHADRASGSTSAPTPTADSDRPTLKRPDTASPSPVPAAAAPSVSPAPGRVELPVGTNLRVRLVDPVDSDKDKVGKTFAATLDAPIQKAGATVIPAGAEAVVKLGDSGEAGAIALNVVSVKVNGRVIGITTETLLRDSDSGKRVKVATGTVLSFALDSPVDF